MPETSSTKITLNPSDDGRQWVISDPELSRLIRARTNDGQEVCLFLIDVMWGRVEGIRVGHRVSAARELLNRAFGRNQGIPLPIPPPVTAPRGTIKRTDLQAETAASPESEAGSEPVEEQPSPSAQTNPEQQVESTPVRPELVEGPESIESPLSREPVEEQSEPALPEGVTEDNLSLYRAASRCIDPNYDPMRAATDDDYFDNYDGCDNISCPFHGDPEDPDFDANAHHY